MAITQKELNEAMVGNRLALSKLYPGVSAADSLASLPAGALAWKDANGSYGSIPAGVDVDKQIFRAGQLAGASLGTSARSVYSWGPLCGYLRESGVGVALAGIAANALGVDGDNITAFGVGPLYKCRGSGSTGFGFNSGYNTTTGQHGTYLAYKAGEGNVDGNGKTCVGFDSNLYDVHGDGISVIGESTLRHTYDSDYATGLGAFADLFHPAAIGTGTPAAGSALGVGVYFYKVAFTVDGVDTGPSPILQVTTTTGNQAVNLASIPTYTGPKTCTARKVYRTKLGAAGSGDGAAPYYLVGTIADNTTTTLADTVADASLGAEPTTPAGFMVQGYLAQAFKAGEWVVGSSTARITDLYVGGGVYEASPQSITIHATGGSGTNVAGAALVLAGGKPTGNAYGGHVKVCLTMPGSSGTSEPAATEQRWLAFRPSSFIGCAISGTPIAQGIGIQGLNHDQSLEGTLAFSGEPLVFNSSAFPFLCVPSVANGTSTWGLPATRPGYIYENPVDIFCYRTKEGKLRMFPVWGN